MRPHWRVLGAAVGFGLAAGLLEIAQAGIFSRIIDRAFLENQALPDLVWWLAGWLAIAVIRQFAAYFSGSAGASLAARVKDGLRSRLLEKLYGLGPGFLRGEGSGELANTLTEGVEALDGYFSQYLPQLVLAGAVPVAILAAVFPIDPLSGLVLLLTGPLIPFFMRLIGGVSASLSRRQWTALSRMSAYFLEVIQGLTALKTLGRSREQVQRIDQVSEHFREATMRVLRVTFLSALTLEWLSTLSTALVAVQIGLRLLYGQVSFGDAFFILVLAPAYYAPLRSLGAAFHTANTGAAVGERIFAVLDTPASAVNMARQAEPPNDEGDWQVGDIFFDRVSYRYGDGDRVLREVSLRLKHDQVTALVGRSGAGKSTLAGLLLGFWHVESGSIRISERLLDDVHAGSWRRQVAWVPQKPTIFNGTILENLTLANPDASFEDVQEAARLAEAHGFIEALPQGYHTQVGERGARLSGGQAQRLALARAFLKDAPVLILDEPTAHLDPQAERQIARAVARLSRNRTVLVIAHRLSTVQGADQVIVLDSGKVVQSGPPQTLENTPGYFRQMMDASGQDAGDNILGRDLEHSPPIEAQDRPVFVKRPGISPRSELTGIHTSTDTETIRFLLRLLRPFVHNIALSTLLGFGAIASGVGLMGTSAYIIAQAGLQTSIADLQVAIVGVRFFGLARGLLRYVERLTSHNATFLLLARLRSTFYRALEPLAPARLLHQRGGDLLDQIVSDINNLEGFYVRGLAPFLTAALVVAAGGCFFGLFSWVVASLFGLVMLLAGLGLPVLAFRREREDGRRSVQARTQVNAQVVDCLQGLPDLLVFDRAAAYFQVARTAAGHWGRLAMDINRRSAALDAVGGGLAQFGAWLALVVGVHAVRQGVLDGVWLGALVLMVSFSFEAVQGLPQAAQRLPGYLESAGRLLEVVHEKEPVPAEVARPAYQSLPDKFVVAYQDVSFSYPRQAGEHLNGGFRLQDVNFKLGPGKHLAVVGPNGSGKSTLVNLLLRFWDVAAGSITIDGVDLSTIDPQEVRRSIAVLPQDAAVFNATVRDNLRLGLPDASDEVMLAACRQAQLGDVVQSLPEGLDTWLGERGSRLSVGEAQRLALARAILRDAPLLVLDEPAAYLDPLTEAALRESLNRRCPDRAVLAITHHLGWLGDFDEILVLDGGRIVGRGAFDELIHQDGYLRRMLEIEREIWL